MPIALPSGLRRLTPLLAAADCLAADFAGLPDGTTRPAQVLAAFKAAASCLGVTPRLVHAIDWLFQFTQPQDWEPGARPIVWPSALLQQAALGLSASQVKAINRALIEAGLISMKDSPNGKRWGRRDRQGRIVEAYGFDLSPLAVRHAEFVRLAAEAKAERAEMAALRRRATIARNAITQILETAVEYGLAGADWAALDRETRTLVQALRRVERPAEMALGVEGLERRQREARERLEAVWRPATPRESVKTGPKGAENRPHIYNYKPPLNPQEDTVEAREGGKAPLGGESAPENGTGAVAKLSADELVRHAPRLRSYLRTPNPAWPDIVEAADWLRGELGIARPLWGEACLAMGRDQAALAVALVSAKPAVRSPGGYFHGMVRKAKAGELNLARSIWGLRLARPGGA